MIELTQTYNHFTNRFQNMLKKQLAVNTVGSVKNFYNNWFEMHEKNLNMETLTVRKDKKEVTPASLVIERKKKTKYKKTPKYPVIILKKVHLNYLNKKV